MKKVLLVFIAVLGIAFAANAQNGAIGVRLGGGQGYGAEISYQQDFGGPHRLEVDLGYKSYGFGLGTLNLTGVYQPHFDINAVPNLGWYAGVGARVDIFPYSGLSTTSIFLGVVGQVGVDYYFDTIPLQLSLDIRPCLYLYPATAFQWGDIALGIRYKF